MFPLIKEPLWLQCVVGVLIGLLVAVVNYEITKWWRRRKR